MGDTGAMKKVTEVLEALREERRRLLAEVAGVERAIAALREVLGEDDAADLPAPRRPEVQELPRTGAPVEPGDGGTASEPVPPGPYAEYTGFYEAAAHYLSQVGEPKTSAEIAEALRAGGYPTRAKNFKASVRTMLNRDLYAQDYGIHEVEGTGRWQYRG
jgi:hypothetical protein